MEEKFPILCDKNSAPHSGMLGSRFESADHRNAPFMDLKGGGKAGEAVVPS